MINFINKCNFFFEREEKKILNFKSSFFAFKIKFVI